MALEQRAGQGAGEAELTRTGHGPAGSDGPPALAPAGRCQAKALKRAQCNRGCKAAGGQGWARQDRAALRRTGRAGQGTGKGGGVGVRVRVPGGAHEACRPMRTSASTKRSSPPSSKSSWTDAARSSSRAEPGPNPSGSSSSSAGSSSSAPPPPPPPRTGLAASRMPPSPTPATFSCGSAPARKARWRRCCARLGAAAPLSGAMEAYSCTSLRPSSPGDDSATPRRRSSGRSSLAAHACGGRRGQDAAEIVVAVVTGRASRRRAEAGR
jgi:hypothetical protein